MILTVFQYVILSDQQAEANADKLVHGIRTSNDRSTVIAKVPTTVNIAGVSLVALPVLFEYINDNPSLWADPTT